MIFKRRHRRLEWRCTISWCQSSPLFVSIHIVGIYVITFLIIVVPLEEKHIVRNARLNAKFYPFIIFNTHPIPEEPLLCDHNRERLCIGSGTDRAKILKTDQIPLLLLILINNINTATTPFPPEWSFLQIAVAAKLTSTTFRRSAA